MSSEANVAKAGLEGVVAAQSSISDVNGQEGRLIYWGYDIHDLAEHATFEEVTYLLSNVRRAISLTAKFPTIVTTFERVRNGLEPVEPREDLSVAGNFLYTLRGQEPDEIATRTMDVALVLHADHELNASTFAARVTAATLSDMYSAIASAIGTLKGPLHGGRTRA